MTSIATSEKRESILKTAKVLLFKFGIKRVTVEEICKEAGVSKMTFYKYYSNKMAIARALVLDLTEQSMRDYRTVMDKQIPFAEKVRELILLKLKATEDLSQEFVKDIYKNRYGGLFQIFENKRKESLQAIISDFKIAAERVEIRKEINPHFIAYYMDKIFEMATDAKLLQIYKTEQDLIMELTSFFFYGLGVKYESLN